MKNLKKIYKAFFEGLETGCANIVSNVIERQRLRKYCKTTPPADFKKEVEKFWRKYKKVSPKWAWYYASKNGIMSPYYIPNDIYYSRIDQYFNNRKLGWGFNDKNYYSRIFNGIKQPDVIVRLINGILLDEDYHLITKEEAFELINREKEIVCKPSLETGSGQGVNFWRTLENKKEIEAFFNDESSKDFVIQKVIKQHPDLNKVHQSSINTLRIVSILMPEGVYILSSNLRMGTGSGRIDNVTAGGISCGINSDGTLKKFATTYYTGEHFEKHPQGLVFEGFKVPSYDKAIELIKNAHQLIAHFRLVSWDIAIDDHGDPLLIEANMRKGGINLNQFNNGPLFGEMTERILNEVFLEKKNKK